MRRKDEEKKKEKEEEEEEGGGEEEEEKDREENEGERMERRYRKRSRIMKNNIVPRWQFHLTMNCVSIVKCYLLLIVLALQQVLVRYHHRSSVYSPFSHAFAHKSICIQSRSISLLQFG